MTTHRTAPRPSVIFGPLQRVGSHPLCDDLEREAALRVTASYTGEWTVALLHRLLTDAHERLAVLVPESDLEALREESGQFEKERDEAQQEIEELKARLDEAEAARDEAVIERDGAVIACEEAEAARDKALACPAPAHAHDAVLAAERERAWRHRPPSPAPTNARARRSKA